MSAAATGSVTPNAPILAVRGLTIRSRLSGSGQTIVSDLDFEIRAGETIGIVGESGSGKSMTAKAIMGLLPPGVQATGEVTYAGRPVLGRPERELRNLRGSGIGLVFQDPFTMLNPLLTCGRHITETLRTPQGKRLRRAAARAEAIRRLAEVGIEDPEVADRYPFQLSGGMRQRVGIAAALARDPEVLIADEPSTALDVTTQKAILDLLKSLQQSRGMALVIITHDLRVAFSVSDRLYVLYAGSLLEFGSAAALEQDPMHPYTLGLLLSEPPADRKLSALSSIPGVVPRWDAVAGVCAFSPRCEWAADQCRAARPPLQIAGPGRATACVRIAEIHPELAEARVRGERASLAEPRTSSGQSLLAIDELTKVYAARAGAGRTGPPRPPAVDGVSIHVERGESVGVVGESGSGKTTVARCIVGLERPTAGSITVDAMPAGDYSALAGSAVRALRRTVQMVFQDPYSSLNPLHSVGYALTEALGVRGCTGAEATREAHELLERVGLPVTYLHRKPIALSGGERQRVAIARALAVRPKLIICDEVVSALDVSVQAQILNLLKSVREEREIGLLFITHDLAVVRQMADRIYVMHRGRVVESGPVESVLDHPADPYTVRLVSSVF
jgi:peptide/nickel transport system ATP-binding protein